MAEEVKYDQGSIKIEGDVAAPPSVEATDRGLFDFMGKKEEEKKPQGEAIATDFEHKVHVSGPEHEEEEKKHGGPLEKLHRSGSSSSSSVSLFIFKIPTRFVIALKDLRIATLIIPLNLSFN